MLEELMAGSHDINMDALERSAVDDGIKQKAIKYQQAREAGDNSAVLYKKCWYQCSEITQVNDLWKNHHKSR